MCFEQAHPFDRALEKAEVATRVSAAPFEIWRHPDAAFLQNFHDSRVINAIVLKRKDSFDIRFRADITDTILIGTDSDVANDGFFPDVFLKGLQLEHLRTPAHLRRREIAAEYVEPMIKAGLGVQADNFLTQECFDAA